MGVRRTPVGLVRGVGVRLAAMLAAMLAAGCAGGEQCRLDTDCELFERCEQGDCVPIGDRDGGLDGGGGGTQDAGADASGARDAGDAGAQDADVDAGGGPVSVCQEQCERDEDCVVDEATVWQCEMGRCRSEGAGACTSDMECLAALSGWTVECAGDLGCTASQACVRIAPDEGRCAREADTLEGRTACRLTSDDAIAMPRYNPEEGDDPVEVCGKAGARCGEDGACFEACTEAECPDGRVCNAETERCECASRLGCPSGFECNTDASPSRCECLEDAACEGRGRCREGRCTCEDASECTAATQFRGTKWTCAPK